MILLRRVVGMSMAPTLKPGQIVVALKWPSRPQVGSVVIIWHDGREKIKRIQAIEREGVFVVGDNPDGSVDSRQFGHVPPHAIKAKVIWPRLPNSR